MSDDGLYGLVDDYLSGERTPHPDPHARGAFVGLTTSHDLRHMTRAVLEGVAFGLRDGLDVVSGDGPLRPTSISASGGGMRSSLWSQILADILEVEIAGPKTEEGAAFGAAILACVGAGLFESVDDAVQSFVSSTLVASPSANVSPYREIHSRYRGLYPALAPIFHSTAARIAGAD